MLFGSQIILHLGLQWLANEDGEHCYRHDGCDEADIHASRSFPTNSDCANMATLGRTNLS